MSDETDPKIISEDEIDEVSGGRDYVVRTANRGFEYWFTCDACGQHKELLLSGNPNTRMQLQGTFECPVCGYKRDYSIRVN